MVLVTGATGILGRVIVLELLKRGKSVRATKRPSSNTDEVRHSFKFYVKNPDEIFYKIEWINVDFDDLDSINRALTGVSEVYHCAAKVSFHPKDRAEMYRTNIDGTKNLLYCCENSSVQKFCFVSSMAVFDGLNEQGEVDESCDFNPKLDHSDYAISKHLSEMEVWRAAAEGLNVVIINPGMILGTGNWQQSSGEIFSTLENTPFSFSGGSAYVDVRDVAFCAVELMEKNIFNEKFIIIAENRRYADIGNKVRNRLGLKNAPVISNFALKAGRVANSLFGFLIPKLRMANKTNIEAVTSFRTVSNKKIKNAIGYDFIPIDESIDFHLKNYIEDRKNKNG